MKVDPQHTPGDTAGADEKIRFTKMNRGWKITVTLSLGNTTVTHHGTVLGWSDHVTAITRDRIKAEAYDILGWMLAEKMASVKIEEAGR